VGAFRRVRLGASSKSFEPATHPSGVLDHGIDVQGLADIDGDRFLEKVLRVLEPQGVRPSGPSSRNNRTPDTYDG
jgi:hypothetical protein